MLEIDSFTCNAPGNGSELMHSYSAHGFVLRPPASLTTFALPRCEDIMLGGYVKPHHSSCVVLTTLGPRSLSLASAAPQAWLCKTVGALRESWVAWRTCSRRQVPLWLTSPSRKARCRTSQACRSSQGRTPLVQMQAALPPYLFLALSGSTAWSSLILWQTALFSEMPIFPLLPAERCRLL